MGRVWSSIFKKMCRSGGQPNLFSGVFHTLVWIYGSIAGMCKRDDSSRLRQRSLILGSVSGVEGYEWVTYLALLPYLSGGLWGEIENSEGMGLLIFAIGFLSRPVGGYFFGKMSDIYGYLRAMKLGMLVVVLSVSFMAVVPSGSGQAWLAFYLMLLWRILLGFAHGGVSAAVNVASFDLTERRGGGVSSSLVYSMAAAGKCVSLLVILLFDLLLEDGGMYVWGWRIPLALGAVAGLVILIFLWCMDDSAGRSAPLVESKISSRLSFAKFSAIFFMSSGTVVCYNLWVSTVVVVGVEYFGISERKMLIISFLQTLVFSIFVFVAGLFWDGKNPLRRYKNYLVILCGISPIILLFNFPGLYPSNVFILEQSSCR